MIREGRDGPIGQGGQGVEEGERATSVGKIRIVTATRIWEVVSRGCESRWILLANSSERLESRSPLIADLHPAPSPAEQPADGKTSRGRLEVDAEPQKCDLGSVGSASMKHKRSLLAAAVAVVLACAAAAWALWLANRPTMAEAYERLRLRMPHDEVERMLGGSGRTSDEFVRWLDNRSPVIGTGTDLLNEYSHLPGIEYWYSDNGVIIVRFDSGGRVADKQLLGISVSTARQTIIRVREWMGWRATARQKLVRAREWMGW